MLLVSNVLPLLPTADLPINIYINTACLGIYIYIYMPRHVDASRDFFYFFILFSPNEKRARAGGGDAARLFSFFPPVQQTTSRIDHRVK